METSRSRRVGSSSAPRRRPQLASTHFFKVVLPSTAEKKMLRIPPGFVNKFGSELFNVATLTTPSGFKQQIRLKWDGNEIWFDSGWCEFAEHHSIEDGYFLVFNYKGNSYFQVLIFHLSACEIDYPCNYIDISESDDEVRAPGEGFRASQGTENERTRTFDGAAEFEWIPVDLSFGSDTSKGNRSLELSDVSRERVIELDDEFDASMHMKMEQEANFGRTDIKRFRKLNRGKKIACNQHNQLESKKTKIQNGRGKFTKLPNNNAGMIELLESRQDCAENFSSQKLSYVAGPNRDAVDKAKMLKLKNPSFVIIMRPQHFRAGSLYVPARFARTYLARVSKYICIQDLRGRNWRLNVYKDRSYLRLLSGGWKEISKTNKLKGGDICVFELIRQEKAVGLLKLYRVR